MTDWRASLRGEPLPWLLHTSTPAVRHLALRQLLDRTADDPDVRAARALDGDPLPERQPVRGERRLPCAWGATKAVLALARVGRTSSGRSTRA